MMVGGVAVNDDGQPCGRSDDGRRGRQKMQS